MPTNPNDSQTDPFTTLMRAYPEGAPLSGREVEVVYQVTAGHTNRVIGDRLGISERTVREHVARIMLKLRVRSRVEIAVIATKLQMTANYNFPTGPDQAIAPTPFIR
jgi:DNA-binding NarL/FixJ family response regulator